MSGNSGGRDKKEARMIAIVLVVLVLLLFAAGFLLIPSVADFVQVYLSPGVGLKDAAVISFFVTVAVMIVFAFAAGDSLIGEIQFMLGGFFSFFVIIWLLVAWIF